MSELTVRMRNRRNKNDSHGIHQFIPIFHTVSSPVSTPQLCISVRYNSFCSHFHTHILTLKSTPLSSTQEYNCKLKICENSLTRKEFKLKLNSKKWEE